MPNKHGFTYRVEQRDDLYFVVCNEANHELCPWFESRGTALEMAGKVSRGDEYCDSIPSCPIGSPVPRPKQFVFVPTKERPDATHISRRQTPAQRERRRP